MPEKYKLRYNKNGKISSWSVRNQLRIAIQEVVDELPVRNNILNDDIKLPNINEKMTYSPHNHYGFKSRCIL